MSLRHLISRASLLLMLLIGTSAVASAQDSPFPFEDRTDPVLLVASYYNAINVGDYARAYSYWEDAPGGATLAAFTAGFADTERFAAFMAAPVQEDPGAGNVFAQVPVLLTALHTDGTQHIYAGCVTVHKTNVPVGDATEPDPNWSLRDADLEVVPAFDLGLLQAPCDIALPAPSPFDAINSPVNVLASYFDAITLRDYARAYGYWESPPAPTLAAFSAGYAETLSATLVIRADAFEEGAAGSIYASIPAVVTATTTGGETQYFGGCYALRKSNVPVGDATEPSPDWHIFSADVQALTSVSDGLALIDGVCQTDAAG